MTKPNSFITYECKAIKQILQNEQWLEGERRGCPVEANDPVVLANVCAVVLRIGAEMRFDAEKDCKVQENDKPSNLAPSTEAQP